MWFLTNGSTHRHMQERVCELRGRTICMCVWGYSWKCMHQELWKRMIPGFWCHSRIKSFRWVCFTERFQCLQFSVFSLSQCFLLLSTPSCPHFVRAFLFPSLCLVVSSTQSVFSMPLYKPDHSTGVSMFSCPLISWHTWQPHEMFAHRQAFHSKWIKFYKSTSSYLKERISEIFYQHYNELNS